MADAVFALAAICSFSIKLAKLHVQNTIALYNYNIYILHVIYYKIIQFTGLS